MDPFSPHPPPSLPTLSLSLSLSVYDFIQMAYISIFVCRCVCGYVRMCVCNVGPAQRIVVLKAPSSKLPC